MTDYALLNMWLEERGISLSLSQLHLLMPIIDIEELLAELGIDAKELGSKTKEDRPPQVRDESIKQESIVVGVTPPFTDDVKETPPENTSRKTVKLFSYLWCDNCMKFTDHYTPEHEEWDGPSKDYRSPYGRDYFGRNYDPDRP